MAKPNKQSVITNKNLRYIIIQLNPALGFGVRHLAFDCCDLQVAESVSKDTLNECGSVDALFAKCFADVPAEVHQVNAFEY